MFLFLMSIVLCRLAAFHAVVYMRFKKVLSEVLGVAATQL
jgi:hypothetical protein